MSDLDSVLVGVGEPKLESTEEACRAQHRQSHEPEFSEHSLPLLDTDSLLALQVFKDVDDPFGTPLC